jgi:hypothetical protein
VIAKETRGNGTIPRQEIYATKDSNSKNFVATHSYGKPLFKCSNGIGHTRREQTRALRGKIFRALRDGPQSERALMDSLPTVRVTDFLDEMGRLTHPINGYLSTELIGGTRIYRIRKKVPV